MPIEIVESSPKAAEAKVAKNENDSRLYPFDELKQGQSFTVPMNECNWKSLRVMVYQHNSRKAISFKEFAFIKHDDLGLVEVARIK